MCIVACWREAYAHLLSPAFLDAMDVAARQAMWERAFASGALVHVAVVADEVVGFACAGPPIVDGESPTGLQLYAIYLRAAHHGTGAGQQLLDAAIGDRPAFLWVAEDNPRAHSFYRRNGFRPDGARMVEPDFEDMAEVRLVRGVDGGSATEAGSTG
jgi:GNAT superfamily N-acetyltransferase